MIELAIHTGTALLEARANVERGTWLDWMERNLKMDGTTAYRYMRIAEHADRVRAAHASSLNDAIMILAEQPRRGHGPLRYSDADKAVWVELVDQVGVKRAAAALGVAASTIHKWASPNSPYRHKAPPRSTESVAISDETIERLGEWLVARFGGYEYPERVTTQVRADALAALEASFGVRRDPRARPAPIALAAAA